MKVSILNALKGVALAAVVLAVPAFAACGLMANSSRDTSVELAAEHDPLRNVSNVVEAPNFGARAELVNRQVDGVQTTNSNWVYTAFTIIVPPKSPAK
jgi:hypothetical protein